MNKQHTLDSLDQILSISVHSFSEEDKRMFVKRINDHFKDYSMSELISFAKKYNFDNTALIEDMLRLYDITLEEVLSLLKNKLS